MIRSEIIQRTIESMGIEEDSYADPADSARIERFVDHLIATIAEQLPDGDIKTCDDFEDLGVACCNGCHYYHPETGMRLVTLPEGSKAWICCALRTALLGPDPPTKKAPEAVAKEAAISAKVAAIPREERFDRAMKLALECGGNPTEDQSLEFAKLFFGPDVIITCR
jgi:hypothetical protein